VSGRARDLRRLLELEASGASFSRNRDFAFYAREENRRARHLRRWLRQLAQEILQLRRGCEVWLDEVDEDRYELRMIDGAMGSRRRVPLSGDEVRYIATLLGEDAPTALLRV
jgi:hypothetical protein